MPPAAVPRRRRSIARSPRPTRSSACGPTCRALAPSRAGGSNRAPAASHRRGHGLRPAGGAGSSSKPGHVRLGDGLRRHLWRCPDPLRRPVPTRSRSGCSRCGRSHSGHAEAGATLMRGAGDGSRSCSPLVVLGAEVAAKLGPASPAAATTGPRSRPRGCAHTAAAPVDEHDEIANPTGATLDARLRVRGRSRCLNPGSRCRRTAGAPRGERVVAGGVHAGGHLRRLGGGRLGGVGRGEGAGTRRYPAPSGAAMGCRRRRHDQALPFVLGGDEPVHDRRGHRRDPVPARGPPVHAATTGPTSRSGGLVRRAAGRLAEVGALGQSIVGRVIAARGQVAVG